MSTRERRSLGGNISLSKKVNSLSLKAAMVYTWSIPHFDDYGYLEGDARILKATIVPLRDDIPLDDIEPIIKEIGSCTANATDLPLWIVFAVQNIFYIHDPRFEDHQTFHGFKRKPSKIRDILISHEYTIPNWCRVGDDWVPEWFTREEKRSEEKRSEEKITFATEEGFAMADSLYKGITAWNPYFHLPSPKRDLNRWGVDIDRIMRIDKRPPELVEKVIQWVQEDEFWRKNVMSGEKLRKQFNRLVAEMSSPRRGGVKKQDGIDRGVQRLKEAYHEHQRKQKAIEHNPG